ncbi:MAG: acetate/propionate family kinase [Beutenbergiaceae bacterium]
MSRAVLVINSGSSSLKYQVVDAATGHAVAVGLIERIGIDGGRRTHTVAGRTVRDDLTVADHDQAMAAMMAAFADYGPDLDRLRLAAVGHRVVQGGEAFTGSVLIDDDVVVAIEELSDLAPLHNPGNAAGIRVARQQFPGLAHVAVFDTAFHSTIPAVAHTYALDRDIARRYQIRRYGFHGTSHAYVSRAAAQFLGKRPEDVNVIVLHLGNGASACAVRGGVSVDTSMGLTPLQGLVMGTRTGDIDPAVAFHLARTAGMDIDDLDTLFNKRSGMLGLTGRTDMRDIQQAAATQADAQQALDIYCYRLRSYVGAYMAVLGSVDAIVFTAGVGENSAVVRAGALTGLTGLGIDIDEEANQDRAPLPRDIATATSAVRVLVIGTDEEAEIARQAIAVAGLP